MQARGPLMTEHRLIEKMLAIVKKNLARIDATHNVDPGFVDAAVDFIRMYADRTHHGKEEDILFRDLDKRPLSAEHRRQMQELAAEHAFGRKTTQELIAAGIRCRNGDADAWADVAAALRALTEFYPQHIAKEDKIFFPQARAYFTDAEDQAMLREFWEFDRKMIHEKYKAVVEGL